MRSPLAFLALVLVAAPTAAWTNTSSLRFFGTGAGQQDRVRIRVDDDVPGVGGTPADVGAAGFTLEFWVRGTLVDNASSAGTPGSFPDFRWIEGNVVLDRDVYGGTERDFGVSIAGGRVRFGTGRGDAGPDGENTLEGGLNVLDGAWHHVACVRDRQSGVKRIHVDGALDVASAPGTSTADLSYPDAGAPGQSTPWGPFLVVGAEKHDAGPQYPSYSGFVDEVAVWSRARGIAELAAGWNLTIPAGSDGLVGLWSFDEGTGTRAFDTSGAGSAIGDVVAGLAGNAQWASASTNPGDVAPVLGGVPAAWICRGDGSGATCPCGNASPAGGGRGCANSLGVGAVLASTGTSSLSNDTVLLLAAATPDGSALLFQGSAEEGSGAGTPFGDGLRCAGGAIVRLGTRQAVHGAARWPGPGDPAISQRGGVTVPGTRVYQVWYRNAATYCTSATFNLTNGVRVSWTN